MGVPLHVRVALFQQHGTASQAYSATFQAGLEHFGDERGFLAYKKEWGTSLVLSDPLAPRENVEDLISRFLKEHPDTGFWVLSHPIAQILAARGFYVNAMGPDTWLDLTTYNFAGTKKKQLREAVNRMNKGGFVTRESTLAEVGIDKVKALSDAWRQTRSAREQDSGISEPAARACRGARRAQVLHLRPRRQAGGVWVLRSGLRGRQGGGLYEPAQPTSA
jgi:lysylphosphatidylglycerol synthetase-like protein (DUF2156 family)